MEPYHADSTADDQRLRTNKNATIYIMIDFCPTSFVNGAIEHGDDGSRIP